MAERTDRNEADMLSMRLRKYRISCGLTQAELSAKSGVSVRTLQSFESGGDIKLGSFIGLIDALGLSGNLEMIIPDASKRPSAYLKTEKEAKRVRKKKIEKPDEPFLWGDEQ